MKQKCTRWAAVSCLFALVIIISGCTTTSGNFAKLKYDDKVKQKFESLTAFPDYKYYYYGPISFPQAFIGISKDFVLTSEDWTPVDLSYEHLHRWVWGYGNRFPGDMERYGSNIIGPNGKHIGVWYSLQDWQQWARIEFDDQHMLKIGMPINHFQNRRKYSPGGRS